MKRDKDIDRLFKKEFRGFDFQFDAIQKLYKRRDPVPDPRGDTPSFSPFAVWFLSNVLLFRHLTSLLPTVMHLLHH